MNVETDDEDDEDEVMREGDWACLEARSMWAERGGENV